MNIEETAAVIAYFGAAWPTFDPSDDTIDVWVAELGDIDPRDALEAMRSLVRTSDFPPSIAKFRAECQSLAWRRLNQFRPALPRGPMKWPAELVAELHTVLKESSKRKNVPWVTAKDLEKKKAGRIKR